MGQRLLHVIASVNPEQGGPIEGLKQLAAANKSAGHTVEVVSFDNPKDAWVQNFPLRCHAIGPGILSYQYCASLVPWLKAHRLEYDAVIVNEIWQYCSFGTWLALRKTSTPYFVFTHGMLDPWFKKRHPIKHIKKSLYWPWAEYRVLRDAAAVLFTCDEERQLARQSFALYNCRELVVRYGIGPPPHASRVAVNEFAARYPELAEKRNLLWLGRIHPKKGLDITLRAFARALALCDTLSCKPAHLVIAGPSGDAYGKEMKRLASKLGIDDRVTWTGMLTGEMKWGAFRAADAFVLSSHQENFGIAVVEALANGVPTLISNKVNIWHEIVECSAGIVAPDTTAGTTALILDWLRADEAEWELRKLAALDCFEKKFHIASMAESFLEAMKAVRR